MSRLIQKPSDINRRALFWAYFPKFNNAGVITDVQAQETAECVLTRIYTIQNNQILRNALKLKNELE